MDEGQPRFREFDTVRVARLLMVERDYGRAFGPCHAPQVGDIGSIVHVYAPTDPAAPYIVESAGKSHEEGGWWLADFLPEELEPVDAREG